MSFLAEAKRSPAAPAAVRSGREGRCRQFSRQGGYATLGIGVALMLMLSLMTIYLTRSGILDLRTSANKARYAEALAVAERRLDVGLAWLSLSANRATLTPANDGLWPLCNTLAAPFSGLGSNWRCRSLSSTYTGSTGNVSEGFVVATPNDVSARGRVYYIVATGQSADSSANAVVKQGVFFYSAIGDGLSHAPPLMGAGNVPLNGTFNVVANPNGGGTGVPISVWSRIAISVPSGSAATCQLHEYTQSGDCSSSAISSSSGKGVDIVDNDASFPADVFQYVFGVPTNNYGAIKAQATQVANCTNLAGLKGIVWVNGSCTISGTVGSVTDPIILVVEGGDFTMNANSRFYGLLFAFGPNGDAGSITANGGAKFYGSMISNDNLSMGININGTFDLIFTRALIDEITSPGNTQYKPMARIPGSWADYL